MSTYTTVPVMPLARELDRNAAVAATSSAAIAVASGATWARADEVRNYLVQKYGFPAARLRTAGNGPDKPIDSNATPDGREKIPATTW